MCFPCVCLSVPCALLLLSVSPPLTCSQSPCLCVSLACVCIYSPCFLVSCCVFVNYCYMVCSLFFFFFPTVPRVSSVERFLLVKVITRASVLCLPYNYSPAYSLFGFVCLL